jgi:hypothetical protein
MSTYGHWKFAEAPTPFPHLPELAWSRVLRIIPLTQKHGNHNVIRAWWEPAGLLGVVIEQQLVQLCMKNLTVVPLLLYIGIEQTFPGIDDKPVSDMVFCEALQFNTMCTWNIQHKALLLMVWKWTPVINRSWSEPLSKSVKNGCFTEEMTNDVQQTTRMDSWLKKWGTLLPSFCPLSVECLQHPTCRDNTFDEFKRHW